MTIKEFINWYYNIPISVFDEDLDKIFNYLASIKIKNYKDKSTAKEDDIKTYNQKFFDNNIPLHSIYTKNKNGVLYETNPFDIVEFKKDWEGTYAAPIMIKEGKKEKCVGFEKINISKNTMLTYGTLGHEITHTQVVKDYKNIKDIINNEMLSIFIEFVISSTLGEEISDNKIRERFRVFYNGLLFLKKEKSPINTIDPYEQNLIKYTYSTLKALHLYDIYINSNIEKRVELLSLVEDVFQRRLTVEKLLKKMNVTYQNSNDPQLVKEYVRRLDN